MFTPSSCRGPHSPPDLTTVYLMRDAYYDQLDAVVDELVTMTHEVGTAVGQATRALLEADAEIAEQVISHDDHIDAERDRIEELAFELIALQQPVAGDLRMLVAALRMVSDLERMGDLSVHVAKIARLRVPDVAIPTEMLPTIKRMAEVAEEMVRKVEDVIANRDVEAAIELERCDEEMDQLRRKSFHQMLGDDWAHGVEPAVDIALLGRYYERIADHAVSLARRVVFLVTGQHPSVVES
jgi:phosphate transport system protein